MFKIKLNNAYSEFEKRSTLILNLIACAAYLVLCAARVYPAVSLLTSAPMNGAFQLFNPLKRLASGEMITKDFDFFHGAGVLYAHYPAFVLFGGDLLASELARQLMSPIAFLCVFVVVGAALRLPLWVSTLGASFNFVLWELLNLGSTAVPGNSLIGLRSSLSILALPITMICARSWAIFQRPVVFHAMIGIVLGISAFVAYEQALIAFGVHAIVLCIVFNRAKTMNYIILNISAMALCLMGTWMLLLGAVSGWRIEESFRFVLQDVSKDQFWYYGAPPNPVPTWADFFKRSELIIGFWLPLILIVIEICRIHSMKSRHESTSESQIIFIVLGAAMISQIFHLPSYSQFHFISSRNSGIVLFIWVASLWPSIESKIELVRLKLYLPKILILGFVAFAYVLLALQRGFSTIKTVDARRTKLGSDRKHGRMNLSKEWNNDFEVWQELASDNSIVSGTYRSLVDDISPSDFAGPDYIIHALGSKRPDFLASVERQKPDWFLTINPNESAYEEWLHLRHWDLYEHLCCNYRPIKASAYHIFWMKLQTNTPRREELSKMIVVSESNKRWESSHHVGSPCVYVVTVKYNTYNPLKSIPLIGKAPRFLMSRNAIAQSGATRKLLECSLPPHECVWTFPIVLNEGERALFEVNTIMPTLGVNIDVDSVIMKSFSSDPFIIDALTGGGGSGLFAVD